MDYPKKIKTPSLKELELQQRLWQFLWSNPDKKIKDFPEFYTLLSYNFYDVFCQYHEDSRETEQKRTQHICYDCPVEKHSGQTCFEPNSLFQQAFKNMDNSAWQGRRKVARAAMLKIIESEIKRNKGNKL